MAKVIHPLLSEQASGKIKSRLTFSVRKSGQQVRIQKAQKDVLSVGQIAQRDIYKNGVLSWWLLSSAERASYSERAKNFHMSGYNLYMQGALVPSIADRSVLGLFTLGLVSLGKE